MQTLDADAIEALVASAHYDEALVALADLSRRAAMDSWAPRVTARLYMQLGKYLEARSALHEALARDPRDVASLWAAYELEQVLGNPQAALRAQTRALAISRLVAVPSVLHNPPGRKLRPSGICKVLMLCVPGTYQANNPLEYIVDGSTMQLHKLYLTGEPLPPLAPYDVVFNAMGYAHGIESALVEAARFVAAQDKACINQPDAIPLTSREAIARRFRGSNDVVAAASERITRAKLLELEIDTPLLLRPLNSQAGSDFAKIHDRAELGRYLETTSQYDEYYCCPFVEYASQDGLYRKYRIAFIDGKAYPVHLAISSHWMVHYYSSAMGEVQWMRDEEAIFLNDLASVFSGRAARALHEITASLPLEYFAVDCTLLADGRVFIFEADTAMIVHMSDPIERYPYKHRAMPRIVDALEEMFRKRMLI